MEGANCVLAIIIIIAKDLARMAINSDVPLCFVSLNIQVYLIFSESKRWSGIYIIYIELTFTSSSHDSLLIYCICTQSMDKLLNHKVKYKLLGIIGLWFFKIQNQLT